VLAGRELGRPVDAILLVIGLRDGRILVLRIVRKATVMTMRCYSGQARTSTLVE
jgi:hypothetical protein